LPHPFQALRSQDIALAIPSQRQADAVAITLNNTGIDKMIALTTDMAPRRDRIAIVLDNVVISTPAVAQVPLGKTFIIEGLREPGEAQSVAGALMNPFEFPLVVVEVNTEDNTY
jgi:preprotein translocase subunit SecD